MIQNLLAQLYQLSISQLGLAIVAIMANPPVVISHFNSATSHIIHKTNARYAVNSPYQEEETLVFTIG